MNLDAVLLLGQKLVKEYELEETNDTLSKWMINYVAELLLKCEEQTATDEDKKECCDIILELWKHKSEIFKHRKPLKKTTELMSSLDNIFNPDPYRGYEEPDEWLALVNKTESISHRLRQFYIYRSLAEVVSHDEEWQKVKVALELDDDLEVQFIDKINTIKDEFEARSGDLFDELTENTNEFVNLAQKITG